MNPADLVAPVLVAELDLVRPIGPIRDCQGFHAVRLLVRHAGQPLGWLTITDPGSEVSAERIEQALVSDPATPLRAVVPEAVSATAAPPAGGWPPISVVVCTRDRAGSLERCLDSLVALDYPDYEIIVVDNASTSEDTRRLAGRYPVRYVREDTPGLDWARNRGLAEAAHRIIAFTDDDARVDREWLRSLALGFRDPAVMLVTGLVAPDTLETQAQVVFELQYGGMGKGFRSVRWDRRHLDHRALLSAHHLGVGANLAVRRDIIERIGPFDTRLDVGTPSHGGGDLDLFHRVLVSGAVARYQPRALVWHTHRREPERLAAQLRDNGRAFLVYLMTQWAAAGRRPGGIPRRQVAGYGLFVWVRWLVGRLVRRFRRREKLSVPYQLAELQGVLAGPLAYVATQRNDRRLRRDRAGGSIGVSRSSADGMLDAGVERSLETGAGPEAPRGPAG